MPDIYVNPLSGLNTNQGTIGQPKATWGAAVAALVSGTLAEPSRILLANGMHHDPTNGFHAGVSAKSNIYIGGYGPGDKPILDAFVYEPPGATGWVHEGGGVWSKKLTTQSSASNISTLRIRRVFVGSLNNGVQQGQRTIGTAYRRAIRTTGDNLTNILNNLNANDIWWSAGNGLDYKLYIWTGKTGVNDTPPNFYGGLAFVYADGISLGAYGALTLEQVQGCTVEGISSWGSFRVAYRLSSRQSNTVPVQDILIKDCEAHYMLEGAFRAMPVSEDNFNPGVDIKNFVVEGMIANSQTSQQEQEPSTSYGNLAGAMDMYAMYDEVKNGTIQNCTSINSWHVGYVIGAYSYSFRKSDNCKVDKCYSRSDSWHSYSRGISMNMSSPNCSITRTYIDGQNIRSQLAGSGLVEACTWVNMGLAQRDPTRSGWVAFNAELLDRGHPASMGAEQYYRSEPDGIRLRNCMAVDPAGAPVTIQTFNAYNFGVPEPVIRDYSIEIENNILLDRTPRALNEWLSINNLSSPVGPQNLGSNFVYKGAGQPAPYTRIFTGSSSSNANVAFNAFPGERANVALDPKVNLGNLNAITLSPDSPCLRSGSYAGARLASAARGLSSPPTVGPFAIMPVVGKPF